MLLTTYGMVLHNAAELGAAPRRGGIGICDDEDEGEDSPGWDVIFMDEVALHAHCLARTYAKSSLSRHCCPLLH